MSNFTRRTLVTNGSVLGAAGTLAGSALLEWAKAWAQSAPWKPERDAQLSLLQPTVFVQAEGEAFIAATEAFTKATGVKVTVSRGRVGSRRGSGFE
jgi:multiple sugar transport system substrate-binding protein